MRAVVIHETGGPEVLHIEEIPEPEPEPGEGEVLVRVQTAGVNRFDLNQRAGGAPRLPLVMSSTDIAAGERVDTGERVLAAAVTGSYARVRRRSGGERVPVARRCRRSCRRGVRNSVPCGLVGTRRARRPREGETLLVQGGASSTGQAAIDIGRWLGATVYATATGHKHGRLRELGAEPLAYDDARIGELEADVVFEPLGARTFGRSIEALGRNGRMVTPGAVGDADVAVNLWALVDKRARIEGIASQQAPPEAVGRLLELLAAGEFHPWVEKELPLEQAAEAHRLIESGEVVGRVVLVPSARLD